MKDEYLYNPAGIIDQPYYKIASAERAIADMLYFNPKYYFDAHETIDWKKSKKFKRRLDIYDFTKPKGSFTPKPII